VDGEVCAKRIQKGPKKMKKGLDRVSIVRDAWLAAYSEKCLSLAGNGVVIVEVINWLRSDV
jgi:hypothetical protein